MNWSKAQLGICAVLRNIIVTGMYRDNLPQMLHEDIDDFFEYQPAEASQFSSAEMHAFVDELSREDLISFFAMMGRYEWMGFGNDLWERVTTWLRDGNYILFDSQMRRVAEEMRKEREMKSSQASGHC